MKNFAKFLGKKKYFLGIWKNKKKILEYKNENIELTNPQKITNSNFNNTDEVDFKIS